MGSKGLDGRGVSSPKESTPGDSVQVTVKKDVPGGESGAPELTGPNPGGKSK